MAHAGQKWADDPEAGTHLGNQIIRGAGIDDFLGLKMNGLPCHGVLTWALAFDHVADAMVGKNLLELLHIAKARQVIQNQRLIGQKRGNHQGKSRILRSGNGNLPV